MDLMSRRRALLARVESGGRLPREYQEVKYLESSGEQYILTDVQPTNSIGFYCTFYTKSEVGSASSNYGCIFGGRRSSGDKDFQLTTFAGTPGGSFRFGRATNYNPGIITGVKQTVSLRNLLFTSANGSTVNVATYTWENTIPVALFALRQMNAYTQAGLGCRIYVMRFYDGDNLTHNYVPCYRKADNKPGMYDLVSNTFLTNAGTGDFTVGQDIN